ncbi:MAG: hypothetical protein P0Y53_11810 [Candidatus Pseudobacter hemicellulosilyticus]|uniref:Uncharacterized protein n=1 Tax=Candidatus Pseudobacter hemicellulosilyticus TaxID=3121375 RepID=A0AAJ6BJD8_9BACT|nr:MAG: hypothetical protein P0Y53_11810 [Pseudobacter sp.]
MKKLALLFFVLTLSRMPALAQDNTLDSLFASGDTTAVLDSLMKEFDQFMDSLTARKSFFAVSATAGNGSFSFQTKGNSLNITTRNKLIVSPSLGYYHKSGLGISAAAFMIYDSSSVNVYQYAISPSYDLIRRSFSTGIAYTRYFHKDSLPFYVTPIQNELFAYFSYKKWWLRPTVSLAYGWGSKTELEKRELSRLAALLHYRRRPVLTTRNVESVQDFSLTVSLRKDFDWYHVLRKEDNLTLTPVLLLNSGTQNFGFNTSYTYTFSAIRANSLPGNRNISENTEFRPQSATAALRLSYMTGKLLLQPQVLFDYYIPEAKDRFNTAFAVTAALSW